MTSTLIKAADKLNNLEDLAPVEVVPPRWTGSHVGKRLTEAFETLLALPISISRKSGFWPSYVYEWEDLLAQQEQEEFEKAQQQRAQNRSRVAPSIQAITRMEQAIYWPAKYLKSRPSLMQATNGLAFAHAIGQDSAWLANRFRRSQKLNKDYFWREGYATGCDLISFQLKWHKVPVW